MKIGHEKHTNSNFIEGHEDWISIKNLPLTYWELSTFEAIGEYSGGLGSVSSQTLNLLDCTEARIEVKKNLEKEGILFLDLMM